MIAKSKPGNSPIKSINPGQLPEFLNIGIGGQAGTGKTHFLGTVGKGNKVLLYDIEGGHVSFSSKSFQSDPDATQRENIEVVTFDDLLDPDNKKKGSEKAAEMVHRIERDFDYLIRTKNSDDFSVVAVDSLTEFQALFLKFHEASDPRQSYGALAESLHALIRKAKQIPAHTIFTARLRFVNNEVTAREEVRFEVSPGVWGITSGLFDMIGFYSTRTQGAKTTRELDFNPTNRTPGKDRAGVGKLDDPKLTKLFAAVAGDKKQVVKAA
jgi:hypothetical protein